MTSSARIAPDIQVDRLIDMGRSASGPLFLHSIKIGAAVETQAKQNASGSVVKVRSGNLRSSIHPVTQVRGTLLVGIVAADASYALAVHEGTKEYDIVPVSKKVLAWKAPGGTPVFSMKSHQPARKGKPFLRDALVTVAARTPGMTVTS